MSNGTEQPGRGIRVAFAGAGHWHFSVDAQYLKLTREAGCEIVGLSDDSEQIARARAQVAGCPWTTDIDDLVSRFKPDLVVALPRPDRAPAQVGRLLDLGVPMFAEKPLGVNADGARSLVERAERGWVYVAFPQRFAPIVAKVEELRVAGRLGAVGHVGLRQLNGPPWRYRDYEVPWMTDPAIAGGGPLRNIGIHLTDMLAQMFEPETISIVGAARTNRMFGEPIEDVISAVMKTDDGVLIHLESGYSFARPKPGHTDLMVAGRLAHVHQRRDQLTVTPSDGEARVTPIDTGRSLYEVIFHDALRRFRAQQPPLATVRDCARAAELIDRIYAAAR
ncbi:MAG: Gfo/Idh/MocA family oxidoreductase [Chloroflexota bacterium]